MIGLSLITQKGEEFHQKVEKIILPTYLGQITVLENHIPLISILKEGKIEVIFGKEKKEFQIERGLFRFAKNKATILVDLKE